MSQFGVARPLRSCMPDDFLQQSPGPRIFRLLKRCRALAAILLKYSVALAFSLEDVSRWGMPAVLRLSQWAFNLRWCIRFDRFHCATRSATEAKCVPQITEGRTRHKRL